MSAEMTYKHLGRSGLLVSRIGLGTMNFGYTMDESTSFAVMDAAFDTGVNFFDTADVYGGPQSPDMKQGYGVSEQTVGRWLQRSGRRDDIVLATKVYQPMGLGPNDRRLSAYHIRRACEASLRRLQTDHIGSGGASLAAAQPRRLRSDHRSDEHGGTAIRSCRPVRAAGRRIHSATRPDLAWAG